MLYFVETVQEPERVVAMHSLTMVWRCMLAWLAARCPRRLLGDGPVPRCACERNACITFVQSPTLVCRCFTALCRLSFRTYCLAGSRSGNQFEHWRLWQTVRMCSWHRPSGAIVVAVSSGNCSIIVLLCHSALFSLCAHSSRHKSPRKAILRARGIYSDLLLCHTVRRKKMGA